MAGIRTLTITPGVGIVRDQVTMTSVVDYGAPGLSHQFNRGTRPAYKFTVTIEALRKFQADSFSAFHFFHQGGKGFYWDGCEWSFTQSFGLIGEGNGARKEFFLPNRNIDANSFSVVIDEGGVRSVTTAFSLQAVPGIVTLATAPTSAQDVLAAHAHKYKVRFEPDGLKIDLMAPSLYRAQLMLIETFL